MSLSQQVAIDLPYLRRFARALTGCQQTGDAYVGAALDALASDSVALEANLSPRAALYRLFLEVWNAAPRNGTLSGTVSTLDAASTHLANMTPRCRQAFLLTAVEGFDIPDTAAIIGTDAAGVARLIAEAGRQIGGDVACDVLIVEDEPIIAMNLADLVENLGHRVVGRARTRAETLAAFRAVRPGLMLVDIRLADGSSGLDAVNEIVAVESIPVIFITAFPERLLTGERPEPVFLVSKPFAVETVKAIISQALFFDRRARPSRPLAASA